MLTSIWNEPIKLLMVGKTGVGKSATANTILGKKTFESKLSTSAITKICQCACGVQQEQMVEVVDMPGLFDGGLNQEADVQTVIDKALDAVEKNPDGFDAILMVAALGRFTQEDKQTINILKGIFGKEFPKQYGILVVTHGDSYDPDENDGQTFEQWCSTQKGDFKDLFEECGRRVVLFQNKTKDEDIRAQQLGKLFTLVNGMNIKERYTPKIFEAARLEREKVSQDMKLPRIKKETERQVDKIYNKLKILQSSKSPKGEKKIRKLKKLKDEIGRLLKQLQDEDKGTGALSSVITLVEKTQDTIDETGQNEKLAEAMRSLKKYKKDREIRDAKIKKGLKIAAIVLGISVAVTAVIMAGVVTIPAIMAATAGATAAGAATATAAGAAAGTAAGAVAGTAAGAVAGTATVATATATAVAGTASAGLIAAGSSNGAAFVAGMVISGASIRSLVKGRSKM